MIYIYCGGDISKSREAYSAKKKELTEKNFEIIDLTVANLPDLPKWLYESQALFKSEKAYFAENILSVKGNRELLAKFDTKDDSSSIFIWEEKLEERDLKSKFKNTVLTNFKLPENIFKFLDSIFPSNLAVSIDLLHKIKESTDENIIFFMLTKRLRELILAKKSLYDTKLASWQVARLKAQAAQWEEVKVESFYEGLYKIETATKTGNNYFSLIKSLDILFCFYL